MLGGLAAGACGWAEGAAGGAAGGTGWDTIGAPGGPGSYHGGVSAGWPATDQHYLGPELRLTLMGLVCTAGVLRRIGGGTGRDWVLNLGWGAFL
jgi:hypothetical protein